jgi:uncharacterized membrane protein
MLEIFPEWFQIFFQSMVPWWEGRYAIPYAMTVFGWQWWQAFPIAVFGNILPKYKFWAKILDWLFERTRKKADARIQKYKYIGLILFVAVPIPFTGAWTGALIAYLFGLNFTKSVISIFVGVVGAALIMIVLTLTGQYIWFAFNG